MHKTVSSKIRVDLSADELQAVIKLAEDQIFRVKFIDPKMPGHKKNAEELHAAESALGVLKQALPKQFGMRTPTESDVHLSSKAKAS